MRYHSLFLVSFLLLLHPIVTISTRFNSHEHRQLCRLGVDEFTAAQRAASRPTQPCSVLLTPPPTTRKTHRVMLKRLECVKSTSGGGPDVLNADDIVLRVLVDSQRTEQTWEHDFVGGHVFNFGRPTFDFARKVTFSVVEDDAGEDLDDMVGLFSVSTFSKPGDLVFESQRQGGHYRLHVRVQDLARGSNQIKYKGRLVSVKVKSTTGFGRDDVLLKLHADGEFVKSYSKTMGKGSQWDVDEEWFDVFDDLYFELFEDDILYDDRLGDDELVVPADKQAVERTFVVNGDGGTFEVTLALMPADELRMETGVDAKYEVQLMSVSCTKDQEWDDEPELSIFLDGATRAAKVWKWNDIDDGWHLDFVGQKFEFAHKIKLVMYELDFGRDAMDADDKLGESTIEPSGGGAHERTLHFKQEGAHYTVKLKYHSLTQPSRTAVLKSLKCVTENENWDDEPELIVATDGAEQLKKSWSGVDAGESVTVPRTRFEFREYLDLTMYELDGGRDAMDSDDKLGSSRIKITDSLGRHTVEFTQSGAKYVLTLDISTTPHGSSLVETEADAEADATTSAFTALARYGGEEYGHNIYFDDICALAGDFFVSAVDRGISDSSISVNVAESGRHRTPAEALSLFDSVFRHWTKWVKTPEGAEHVGLYLNMFDKEESSILANAAPNRILYAYLEQELDCTTIECVTSSHDINLGRISMGDMPDLAYVSTTDLYWLHTISDSPFIVAASFNFDHFRDPGDREQGSVLAFKAGIRAAIAYAFENKKGGTGDTCSPDDAKNLAGALARAAHAAHFASDAFAPGHIRNPRRRMYNDLFDHCDGTILSGAEAVGVLAKLMHDEDNIFGVPVKSRDGKRSWTAYGDKSWNYEDNGENRAQAAAMIKFLISAVVDTFEGRCTSKDACEAHALKAVDMLPEVDEEQAYPPLWRWREPNGDQEGAWEYRSSAPDAPGAPDYTTDWGCGAINAIGNSLRSHKKDHEDRNSEEREDQSNPRFRALATPSRGNFGSGSGTVTSMQPPPQTEPGEGSQQAVSSTSTDPAPEEGSQLAAIGRAVSDALDVAAEAVHGLLQRMANREKEVVHIRFKEMDLNNDDRVHLDEFALWVHLKASNTRGVPASLQHLFAAKLFGQLLKTAGSSETFLRESDLEHSFQVLPHVGAGKPVTVSLVRLATRELRRMLALYSKGIRDAVIKGANGEVTLAEATQLFWKIFDDSWVLVDTPAALDISELGKSAAVLRDAEDAQAFVSKTKGAASSQSQTKLTVSVAASTASLATEAGIIESRGALHVRQRMFAKDPTAWNEALERIRAVVTPAAVLSTMDPKSGSDSPLRRFVSETARRKVEQELAPKLLNAWVEGLRKADAEVKKENAIPLAAAAGVAAGAIQPAPQPEATPESTKPSKAKVNKIIRRMEGNLQEALDGFSALTPELSQEPQFNALFSPTTSGKSS